MNSKIEAGFTLVELLVVIGIIAILTAIAVPMFLSQRQKANDTAVLTEMKNAALQVETALLDFNGYTALNEAVGNISDGSNTGATLYLNDDSGVAIPREGSILWNDSGKLPKISYSDGTYMEFIHMVHDIPDAHWKEHTSEFDYCIVGSHLDGKKYDWKPGVGAAAYDQYLFYDKRLGGIVTPDELFDAVRGKSDEDAAEVASCHGYGIRFLNVVP